MKAQPLKSLEILQSPLSQQSRKLQYHVVRISRYCWPNRGRLQPGKGRAVRQGQSPGEGGARYCLPATQHHLFSCPFSSFQSHSSLLSPWAFFASCQGMDRNGHHQLCGSRWPHYRYISSKGSIYSTNLHQRCKKPRPCLRVCSLVWRQSVAGDYHSSYLLWFPKSSDHSQPQRSLNSFVKCQFEYTQHWQNKTKQIKNHSLEIRNLLI